MGKILHFEIYLVGREGMIQLHLLEAFHIDHILREDSCHVCQRTRPVI